MIYLVFTKNTKFNKVQHLSILIIWRHSIDKKWVSQSTFLVIKINIMYQYDIIKYHTTTDLSF